MSYTEITIKVKIPFKYKVSIVESPDGSEIECLSINNKLYMPEIDLYEYEPNEKNEPADDPIVWRALEGDEFEELIDAKTPVEIEREFKLK